MKVGENNQESSGSDYSDKHNSSSSEDGENDSGSDGDSDSDSGDNSNGIMGYLYSPNSMKKFIVSEDESVSEDDTLYYERVDNTKRLKNSTDKPIDIEAEMRKLRREDFKTSFNTYVQYLVHCLINYKSMEAYDEDTRQYFDQARSVVNKQLSTIRDSLVASAAWIPRFLDDMQTKKVYYAEKIGHIQDAACEVCKLGGHRRASYLVYLVGEIEKLPFVDTTPNPIFAKKKRTDPPFLRYRALTLPFRKIMELKLYQNRDKEAFLKEYDLVDFNPNKPLVCHDLGVPGACYKAGRFCQSRSEFYHWLYHYPSYLYNRILLQFTENEIDTSIVNDPNDPASKDPVKYTEELVVMLEECGFIELLYEELVQTFQSARDMFT
ncbi:hypothetical protein AX774_g2893 [Zancudomyces culisetae]|uniref:DUF4211 domain-containing protein n=1 Tax=Zancudomyces culisetae TaxID=1213189 RepID=A0A1R1PRH7_ZANCU|nr:hypothetical protein AX774_g2893 [Zancudomyces culisetae]|eukprot:OMH83590.1 hypothetical protein AX774_g2893 [Zancudomyces culisetae]